MYRTSLQRITILSLTMLGFGLASALWFASQKDALKAPKNISLKPATRHQIQTPKPETQIPEAPTRNQKGWVASKSKPGTFALTGDTFTAQFESKHGLSIVCAPTQKSKQSTPTLTLRLQEAVRGTQTLFSKSANENSKNVGLIQKDGQLSLGRGDHLVERLAPIKHGVELFLDLDERPRGTGDLLCTYDLAMQGLKVSHRSTPDQSIHLVDTHGRHTVRIGQMIAHDAAGRTHTQALILNTEASALIFSLPGAWLDEAQYPVVIDPPIIVTPQFDVTNILAEIPGAPNVTAGGNQFLTIYTDFILGTNIPILKARTVGSGGVVSSPIVITDINIDQPLPFSPLRQQAASDGTDFLVVWSERSGAILGSVIQADGTLKEVGSNNETIFLIALTTASLGSELPLVTFNGDQYVVCWQDKIDKGTRIFFALVAADGSKVSGTKQMGIGTDETPEMFTYSASSGPDNQTLILFTDFKEVPKQIRAHRIDKEGTSLDPQGIKLFNVEPTEFGFGQPIGVRTADATTWRILSSLDQTTDDVLYEHKLNIDGTFTRADEHLPATNGEFARMGVGPIGLIGEDQLAFAGTATSVNLPGGSTGNEWLFVRNLKVSSTQTGFLGRRVADDGTALDVTPFQVDDGSETLRRSIAITASDSSSRFFVAWLEGGPNLNSFRGESVQGVLIDSAGDPEASAFTGAILDVVSLAKPVAIPAGTEVVFDWSASTGSITKQILNFGESRPKEIPTGTFTASHIYKKPGVFLAQISLENGTYQSNDTLRITVGGGTGVEGSDGTIGGDPALTNSPNMNSMLFINQANLKLDFSTPLGKEDTLAVEGSLDLSNLPETLSKLPIAGKPATITIFGPAKNIPEDSFDDAAPDGALSFSFILDGNAEFQSPETVLTNRLSFQINMDTGTFLCSVENGQLAGHLVPDNGTHKLPSRDRTFAFGLTVDGVDFGTSQVIMTYKSTSGANGTGNYLFRGAGKEDTGSLTLISGKIKEGKSKTNPVLHTGIITGRLTFPGGTGKNGSVYTLPANGVWRFQLGDYASTSIDLGNPEERKRFKETNENIQYKAPAKGLGGIQEFKIHRRNGIFNIKINKIPSGANGVGLPAVGIVKGQEDLGILVDLFLGMELVFEDGTLDAKRYFRMSRKNARNKAWVVTNSIKQKKKIAKTESKTADKVKEIIKTLLGFGGF